MPATAARRLPRLLRSAMGMVEERVDELPAGKVLAGALGGAFLGGLSALVGVPFVVLLPGLWGWPGLALNPPESKGSGGFFAF